MIKKFFSSIVETVAYILLLFAGYKIIMNLLANIPLQLVK